MQRAASFLAVAWFAAASAYADPPPRQLVALSGAGGWDLATRQPWAGLAVDFRHDGRTGAALIGGVRGGWAFFDARPRFDVDLGAMGVLPTQENLIRLGGGVGTQIAIVPDVVPFSVGGDPAGFGAVVLLPYGYVATELGWTRPGAWRGAAAWSVGARLGVSAGYGVTACDENPVDGCFGPRALFVGGVSARVRFHEGVFLDALAGPSASVRIGYAFGGRRVADMPVVAPPEAPVDAPTDPPTELRASPEAPSDEAAPAAPSPEEGPADPVPPDPAPSTPAPDPYDRLP